jgi:isoquinoline 1-oxidoreductase
MKPTESQQLEQEPGRMAAPLPSGWEVSRRDFFKTLGSGVMVLYLAPAALAQEAGRAGARGRGGQVSDQISAWLHISEDGTVTVFTGKTEVGQNIRTSLTQAVAEELRAPVSAIKMVMADTDLVPYDMGTFGSQTTPQMASRLHRVAAAAREALLDMAADYLKADRASLTVADGKIFKANADRNLAATFGQLTKGQKITKAVNDSTAITPAGKWTVAGTSVPKVDGRDFVTGRHKYSSDIKLPGMLYAKRLRATSLGAKVVSFDT